MSAQAIRSFASRRSVIRPAVAAEGSNTAAQESSPSPARRRLKPIPVVPHCQGTV
jgi:hypothetical protein